MSGRIFGKQLTSFQIIIAGFIAVILIGAFLLTLPVSTASGTGASLEDALFTSTSAVCVTGLVVRDTATYWSKFGQAVILVLIQIGGLGIVTVAAFAAAVSGKKISLLQRSMLQESYSAHQVGGLVKMTAFIFRTAFAVELIGAVMMLPVFCRSFGFSGIWMSVFHSVSAFCNAGLDIMGDKTGAFSSFSAFRDNPGIVIPVCLLIIIGGIGFLTWEDIARNRLHFRKYRMQSKVIITATALLILIPAVMLFCFDFSDYPLKERICLSVFQAVTPRASGKDRRRRPDPSDYKRFCHNASAARSGYRDRAYFHAIWIFRGKYHHGLYSGRPCHLGNHSKSSLQRRRIPRQRAAL